MRRGYEAIVRPAGENVPDVHDERVGIRRRGDPLPRLVANLESTNLVLREERDEAVVGTGTGTEETVFLALRRISQEAQERRRLREMGHQLVARDVQGCGDQPDERMCEVRQLRDIALHS